MVCGRQRPGNLGQDLPSLGNPDRGTVARNEGPAKLCRFPKDCGASTGLHIQRGTFLTLVLSPFLLHIYLMGIFVDPSVCIMKAGLYAWFVNLHERLRVHNQHEPCRQNLFCSKQQVKVCIVSLLSMLTCC